MAFRDSTDDLLDEMRRGMGIPSEGGTPGQQAAYRAIPDLRGKQATIPMLRTEYAPATQTQVTVEPKTRQVVTRVVAANGQVLREDRRKARRRTRVHLIDGHMDVVETVEGVAQACQAAARASGMFQANVIGGHGQITVNFVPVSSVVRLEDLRR